ncbi:MAG: electron transport complex subunit RsxC [Planctomycetota bacterium]
MKSASSELPGKGTFARGLHPPGRKSYAADAPIEVLPTPETVAIPLLQHLGKPAESVVKPRQEVALAELIAKASGFISASSHASVAGTTQAPSVATLPNARHVRTVPIKPGEQPLAGEALKQDHFGGDWPKTRMEQHTPEKIRDAVADAGIVGLGGAAFPTHVKFTPGEAKIDTLLVNGCECEPYLTADYRLMLEFPAPIITGAMLAGRACGAERIVVAIEDNKPRAADAMRKAAEGTGIEVVEVETRYPMGGERQLTVAVLDREVPTGGLPLHVGVVVLNVATSAAVARAVLRGKPLTHRVVTVTGAGIKRPANVLTPIGASYADLIEHCGGLTDDAARVVSGGPMMGFAVGDLEAPLTKGAGGITVLTHEDVRRAEETQCIRCGRCVDVCPLHLVPTKMALAARNKDWEQARRYYLTACCECGCCAYVCPAAIPLVQLMRAGKAEMPRE